MRKHKILLAVAFALAVAPAACTKKAPHVPGETPQELRHHGGPSPWLCTHYPDIYACSGRGAGTAAGSLDLCCPPGNVPCYEETAAGCSPGEYQGKCRDAVEVGDDEYVCAD